MGPGRRRHSPGRLFAPSNLAINKIYRIFLIEPSEGRYIYTANFLGNTVSGLAMNVATGGLSAVQNTPFGAAQQPTCSAAITHGKHTIAAP